MTVVISHNTQALEFIDKFNKKYPNFKAKLTNGVFFHSLFGHSSAVRIKLEFTISFWIVFWGDYATTETASTDTVITQEQVKIAQKAEKLMHCELRIIQ